MITRAIGIIVIGAAAGAAISFLLRDRGKLSYPVVAVGVGGAALGALFRQAVGPEGALLWVTTVLLGAMIASTLLRFHLFGAEPL